MYRTEPEIMANLRCASLCALLALSACLLDLLGLMLFSRFYHTRYVGLDKIANYTRGQGTHLEPPLDSVLFESYACWTSHRIVGPQDFKELAIPFILPISRNNTVSW
jgi:hypothetical protein